MGINILDSDTINKIAAGEVVERPSSVVKELVENAIDAKATAITVEIKEGGIAFIRITDNGSGIQRDDIRKAFLRHATSKIKSVEDLLSVSSLGFRGEALSSIAAVAQVELITKTSDSTVGCRYVIEGGKEEALEDVGAPDGTTIIVRNLFYNTPVRRKFLKSAGTEGSYIAALIEHLSLSHPDISFRFISNNQSKLHTSGNMNLKDIIYGVYGKDITRNIIPVDAKTNDIQISGFIGRPVIVRGNRTYENYYINGRYIRSSVIAKAIEDAYKGYIMPHNYPFCALHFTIEPSIIDVNVHPTKMELRFSKNELVYDFVYSTLANALKYMDLAVEVKLVEEEKAKPTDEGQQRTARMPEPFEKNRLAREGYIKEGTSVYKAEPESKVKQVVEPKHTVESKLVTGAKPVAEPKPVLEVKPIIRPAEVKRAAEAKPVDKVESEPAAENKPVVTYRQESFLDISNEKNFRIIGQLFDTYWLVEFEDKFYIMDQHAAHEKIIYERFMKQIASKSNDIQMLMPAIIVELSLRELEVLNNNKERFMALGFEFEEFGNKTIKITGIPASLPNIDVMQMFMDLLGDIAADTGNGYELLAQRVATMACKAAIKGNNRMSELEAKELIDELMKAENPFNCPHGRPTLIVMSKYEIERKFKRII